MYFTQEDYRRIEKWLYQRVVKDSDLPIADPMDGSERIAIIQDNKNKIIGLNRFVEQVANMKLPDFYNVSVATDRFFLNLEEAISLISPNLRKLGLTITYHNKNGNWSLYQFKGASLNQWMSPSSWNNIIQQAMEEVFFYPDEEDITSIKKNNKTVLKFSDREYNPDKFSGKGYVILRKNLIGNIACSIDEEDHLENVLEQSMINHPNTIYVIKYDFNLKGQTLSIPDNSILWFQGGSINNGTLYLHNTTITGVNLNTDIGDVLIAGTYRTGQLMTFIEDSIPVLKWWNGKRWKSISS